MRDRCFGQGADIVVRDGGGASTVGLWGSCHKLKSI
jgi:ssDNA-binding replication factor A large subunit